MTHGRAIKQLMARVSTLGKDILILVLLNSVSTYYPLKGMIGISMQNKKVKSLFFA
jgi:hypothetical protein